MSQCGGQWWWDCRRSESSLHNFGWSWNLHQSFPTVQSSQKQGKVVYGCQLLKEVGLPGCCLSEGGAKGRVSEHGFLEKSPQVTARIGGGSASFPYIP